MGEKRVQYGVSLPTLFPETHGRKPQNWSDVARWLTHLAHADDLLLIAKSAEEAGEMLATLRRAITQWGLRIQDHRLEV